MDKKEYLIVEIDENKNPLHTYAISHCSIVSGSNKLNAIQNYMNKVTLNEDHTQDSFDAIDLDTLRI